MKNTTISPEELGLAFGLTAIVSYISCVITLAAAAHHKAIICFNSLLQWSGHCLNFEDLDAGL